MPRLRCTLIVALAATAAAAPAATAQPAQPLTAALSRTPSGPPMAENFLGLSFEAREIPQMSHYGDEGNLVALLRALGRGVARFGGTTVDTQAVWSPDGSKPSWATTAITPNDFGGVGRLLRGAGWSVLLGLNLGHYDPSAAAAEAAAAQERLGTSLAGLEFGNEPNSYVPHMLRSAPWGFDQYRPQVDAYRQALAAAGVSLPLVGPDVASLKDAAWVTDEASAENPALLSVHYYPLSACDGYLPVTADLTGPGMNAVVKRKVARMAAISRTYGIPLRIGETNNISCGGEHGVSNTLASALWATGYLARAVAAGLAGINFHDLIGDCKGYAPICARSRADLRRGHFVAEPEYYALLLARQLIGNRPLPSTTTSAGNRVVVQAFAIGGRRVHVLIVNDEPPGSPPMVVKLKGLRTGRALRLTGPGPSSTTGVQLGGATVAPNGTWHARRTSGLRAAGGSLEVPMPPSSAALVTATR